MTVALLRPQLGGISWGEASKSPWGFGTPPLHPDKGGAGGGRRTQRARRGGRADTGSADGHLTPPPTLGVQIHFPPGSNKKQSWERGRKWQRVSFVDNEKQKVKEGLCLLGISLVSSWGLISLNLSVFHYPQGCFFLLMERKALISRAGLGRQDITVPYLPAEQPALPAGYETLSDTDRNSLQRDGWSAAPPPPVVWQLDTTSWKWNFELLVHSEECSGNRSWNSTLDPQKRPGLGRGTGVLMDALPLVYWGPRGGRHSQWYVSSHIWPQQNIFTYWRDFFFISQHQTPT